MAYPSTFLDLQNSVIAKGRLDATADLAKVKDWLNQAYADAILQTEAIVTTTTITPTSAATQSLSASILRIKGMYITAGGVQSQPMLPVSVDEILTRRQGTASGYVDTPTLYALSGLSTIDYWPTPRGTETITVYAVTAPTALSANGDVPAIPEPFASKLLEYGALAEAADFKRDDQMADYQQRYQEWIGKLRAHLARKKGGVPQQMAVIGSPSYPPHDPSTDTG